MKGEQQEERIPNFIGNAVIINISGSTNEKATIVVC